MCLQKIQPSINLSFTIPRSMSARYQYGITVADACKVNLLLFFNISYIYIFMTYVGINLFMTFLYNDHKSVITNVYFSEFRQIRYL